MNILKMLQLRCDFQGNTPVKQPEALAQSLPEEMLAFFRQADGGRGWLFDENRQEAPDLVLYACEEWDEKRKVFLEEVRECYECWVLLVGRSLNEAEEERLHLLGDSLTVLGECGDPEAPDYLCLRKGIYFLAEYRSLENLLMECPEKPALEEKSFCVFLDRVLRAMELSKVEWLEMERETDNREGDNNAGSAERVH